MFQASGFWTILADDNEMPSRAGDFARRGQCVVDEIAQRLAAAAGAGSSVVAAQRI